MFSLYFILISVRNLIIGKIHSFDGVSTPLNFFLSILVKSSLLNPGWASFRIFFYIKWYI